MKHVKGRQEKFRCVCKGRHETLRPETMRDCRAKLMITGYVNDERRNGCPFTN